MKQALFLISAATAWSAQAPALAQDAAGAHCELSATPLVFGRYSPTSGSPSDFTATLTVACASPSGEPVAIEGSIALLGSPTERRLAGGSGELRYQLYLDAGRSRLWGDGSGGGRTAPVSGVVGPNTVFRQTITIYGRILARQTNATVGAYSDQIEAVLQY